MPEKRYDPEMLRDFLEHLMYLVRHLDFNLQTGPTAIHPELLEQVLQYFLKYKVGLFIKMRVLDNRDATPEQIAEARRLNEAAWRKRYGEYLRCLETLEPLFTEALQSLESGDAYELERMIKVVTPAEIIEAGGDV